MKNSKLILLFFFFLINVGSVFSQSDWMNTHADKRISEINAELVSVDSDAVLSQGQKEQLHTLLIESFLAIRDIKKGEGTDDEKSTAVAGKRKELWAKVHQDIFTKEQKAARKQAKRE